MKRNPTCPICHSVISADKMVPVYGSGDGAEQRHRFHRPNPPEEPTYAEQNIQEPQEIPEHRPAGHRQVRL